MSSPAPPVDDLWTNLGLVALAGAVASGGAVWVAGAATAVMSGHQPPDSFGAPWRLLTQPGDASAVWGRPVGPVWLLWLLLVLLLAAVLVVTVVAWTRWGQGRSVSGPDPYRRKPELWPGVARRGDVAAAAGPAALQARGAVLRPDAGKVQLHQVGYLLGTSRGVQAWASVEDSVVVVGPPRSGKGLHLVINAILDAPGAVITTGTRPDNIAPTLKARSAAGRPVMIFDPQHLAEGLPATTRWSLIRGCADPQVAMSRAAVLTKGAGDGVESGSFWSQQCATAVRCLLHAAALGERSVLELYEWSLSVNTARAAADILADHPDTAAGWWRALSTILDSDPRQRDSVWAMVLNTFAMLADPRVLATVSPDPGADFDPEAFIAASGTAYLLGTSSGASATSALVAAFVDDVVEAARRMAARSTGFRLDPPLSLVLDEAANYPLPALPSLMSEGGGTGISTWVFLQSLAQARAQWGRDDADAIWDAAIVKVVLGGGGHADDLGDLSRLVGQRKERRASVQYGTRDPSRSWQESEEDKAVLEASHIRRIPFGWALLMLRTAPPIMLQLRRWTERRDAVALQLARGEVFEAMRQRPDEATEDPL